MVNRNLKKALLGKLRISPQALSQRVRKLKSNHGPMTTEEATYVIAHQQGLDLSRFLSIEVMDKVRSLVPRDLPNVTHSQQESGEKKKRASRVAQSSYPLVSRKESTAAIVIGRDTYPQIFLLENSIRKLIISELKAKHGIHWWEKGVSRTIRDQVQSIIRKEERYPHREKRGVEPIYYSNFDHLKEIILNNRDTFKDTIINFDWFKVEMEQVYMARNSLAHSAIISEDDRARIRLFYRDWARLLENAGIK